MYQVPEGLPTLSREGHTENSGYACVMEYISVITGDEWSDHPKCTDPLIGSVAMALNDSIYGYETRSRVLVPRIGRLVGTNIHGRVADVMRYRSALAAPVRALDPERYGRWIGQNGNEGYCACSLCVSPQERNIHGVVTRTVNRFSGEYDEPVAVDRLIRVLDRMLDIADERLGRPRRETDTAQRLASFVAELA
jgi:hypothetical protein